MIISQIITHNGKQYERIYSGPLQAGDIFDSGNGFAETNNELGAPVENLNLQYYREVPGVTVRDVECIDAKHFELALDLVAFVEDNCSTLALNDSTDRATLVFRLINSGLLTEVE